jgi:hypothetical protein
MWNALRVLLHRPLVADGHLHLTLPSTSKLSFAACTEAAMNIVKLVRLYDKAFSMGRAPYLMSYATYVAATIHVRIAATRPSSSEAHDHLRTCLRVFDRNSETNYAVRKASVVVEALMDRMGVSIDHSDAGNEAAGDRSNTPNASNPTGPRGDVAAPRRSSDYSQEPTMVAGQFVPGLDVDAIIHSFMQEQQSGQTDGGYIPMANNAATSFPNAQGGDENLNSIQSFTNGGMFDDALFGFNASGYDWYYPNVSHP